MVDPGNNISSAIAIYAIVAGSLVGVLVVFSRLLARTVRRAEWSPSAKRVAVNSGRLVVALLAVGGSYLLYLRVPAFEPFVTGLSPDRVAALGAAVEHAVGMGAPALIGVYAVQRELKPTVDDVCEWTYTVRPRDRRRKWLAITLVVVGPAACFAVISSDGIPIDTVSLFPIVLVLAALASLLCLPFVGHPTVGSRDPTSSERRRIERCYDRFDRSPGTLVIFDRSLRDVAVFDAGRGDSRWTWISESLLESASDDELAVLLAQADERTRRHQWGYAIAEFVLLISAITLFFNAFAFLELRGFTPLNIGIAAVSILGIAASVGAAIAGRRCSYHADDVASRQFGPETVRRTYLEHGERVAYLDHSDGDGFLTRLMKGEPPIDDRIERLTDQYSLDPPETDPATDETRATDGPDTDTDTGRADLTDN